MRACMQVGRQACASVVVACLRPAGLFLTTRALAGPLVEVGKGKLSPDDVRGILQSGLRREAGVSVAPHGLIMANVIYDPDD